jgi:hypothetical protein
LVKGKNSIKGSCLILFDMNQFRVSNDKEQFQEQPIDVKSTTVDQAVSPTD